jgi:pimeloyl-ACP methyl ester carboxylesterase
MNLNFIKSGSGPTLIILHGLFGMLDNWKTIAKGLEMSFTVYLVDQRNHGKSPHTPEHSYQLMALDLKEFMQQQNISDAIIMGHSMGGKTAMQFALTYPEMVNRLIVVDMGIKRYESGHDHVFDAIHAVDLNKVHSRNDAEKMLIEFIPTAGTRQFILKNLTRNPNGTYQWKFNPEALTNNFESEILASIKTKNAFNKPTLFIRGERSQYILNEDWDSIQKIFPNAELITITEAGHWAHADQPEKLLEAVTRFLEK